MPAIFSSLKYLYLFVTGSKYFWRIVRNYAEIKNFCIVISNTITAMHTDKRKSPNMHELSLLLPAISAILRSELIDIPGINEYELALEVDSFAGKLKVAITDTNTGHTMAVVGRTVTDLHAELDKMKQKIADLERTPVVTETITEEK